MSSLILYAIFYYLEGKTGSLSSISLLECIRIIVSEDKKSPLFLMYIGKPIFVLPPLVSLFINAVTINENPLARKHHTQPH